MKEATLNSKKAVVEDIQEKIQNAKSIVFVDYRGITVEQVTDMRNAMRAEGIEYKVLKNTMIKRAADAAGIEGLDEILNGPTAVAFGYEDEIAPARVVSKYAKQIQALEIKGGIMEGAVVDVDVVNRMAAIPSRNELLAKMLGSMNAPIAGFVRALAAIRDQKEENAAE